MCKNVRKLWNNSKMGKNVKKILFGPSGKMPEKMAKKMSENKPKKMKKK